MNVLVTLNEGIGENLGPNFLLTCDVEGWSDTATDTELLAGVIVVIPDDATIVYIQSLGLCLNILELPIEGSTTTTTTTTEQETTTTTTTAIIEGDELLLTFDDLANADTMIGGDSSNVSDWNTFFGSNLFSSLTIDGTTVNLKGGSNVTFPAYIFGDNEATGTSLISVVDTLGCVIACEDGVFSDWNVGSGCYGLTKVSLPNCVTLGDSVFADCMLLDDLTLPFSSFTSLGMAVFNYCELLTDATINQFTGVTSLGDYCFEYCIGLINTNFGLVTSAGEKCFSNCTSLLDPNFDLLETAGNECFNYCIGLTDTDFGNLTSAGNICFKDCTGLTDSANFISLQTAGHNCFNGCEGLINPNFSALTNAGDSCFVNCINLSVPVFTLLEVVGSGCFAGCTGLTDLDLSALTNLGPTMGDDTVFNGITGITLTLTIPTALATDGDVTYLNNNNTLTLIQV